MPSFASARSQVDLAGSERLRKTRSEGPVAKEAQYINKSLSFLEQARGAAQRAALSPVALCGRFPLQNQSRPASERQERA